MYGVTGPIGFPPPAAGLMTGQVELGPPGNVGGVAMSPSFPWRGGTGESRWTEGECGCRGGT